MKKRIFITITAGIILAVGSSFKNDFFEIAKQIEIFTTLFKELHMNYVDETNPARLMDVAIKGMLNDLDPYTVYMNEQDIEAYKIRSEGEYSGIGALIRNDNDRLIILELYKDSPADKAGLKPGDEILMIGNTRITDAKNGAEELLRGAVHTEIPIVFKRQNAEKTTMITLEEIDIDAVPYYGKADKKTGYIVLSAFNEKATKQTEEAITALKAQGITSLILDLRNNPGGLLTEAINVTSLFVPQGEPIVTTKSKVRKFNRTYRTNKKPIDTEIPLVVLINERSASASEIVSGALQDLDRAVIIGTQSYGKGLVQRPLKLTYGTQLKVTISRYYTPSGRCIQAIDYQNKDREGNAMKNMTHNKFRTRSGRTVYDGGGILPDVEITSSRHNYLTKALTAQHTIFNYATMFYYTHTFSTIDDFKFADTEYETFKEFVVQNDGVYDSPTERTLKHIENDPAFKEFSTAAKQDYEMLLHTLRQEKLNTLDTYKEIIIKMIKEELVKRYFYREGLYDYYLKQDQIITTSTALLADRDQFNALLK